MSESDLTPAEKSMTLGEHLEELRRRLICALAGLAVGVALGFLVARDVILAMEIPFHRALAAMGMPDRNLTVLSIGAPFEIYMQVSLYCGLVLSSFWILYQIWAFVAAGLYSRERRIVMLSVPVSAGLFVGGAAFFLLLVAVPAIRALMQFGRWLGMDPIITMQNQIGFMLNMMLVFGLTFQTPLVVFVLAKAGIVGMRGLNKYRRHVIVAITIVAAVLGPGDVVSMIAMCVPMWVLYELGVVTAWLLVFRRRKKDADSGEA